VGIIKPARCCGRNSTRLLLPRVTDAAKVAEVQRTKEDVLTRRSCLPDLSDRAKARLSGGRPITQRNSRPGFRLITGQVDRAAVRATLDVSGCIRDFTSGMEYNPKVGEVHPLITSHSGDGDQEPTRR
jgi:hypothetical protein